MVSVIVNLASVTTYLSHFDIDLHGHENWLLNNDDYKQVDMRKCKTGSVGRTYLP